jgi:hypothetical protein
VRLGGAQEADAPEGFFSEVDEEDDSDFFVSDFEPLSEELDDDSDEEEDSDLEAADSFSFSRARRLVP